MSMKQSVTATIVFISLFLALACGGDETPPVQPTAGVGTAAVGGGVPAAGSGTMMNPISMAGTGVAGQAGPAGAGPAPAGSGAAGAGAAGTGTAGTPPVAGTGVTAGMTGGMAGMSGGMAGGGAAGMPAFTPGSPTFSAIHQEIFIGTGCNGGPSCHSGTVAGALKLTNKMEAYMALVNAKAAGVNIPAGGVNCKDTGSMRVVPGDPAKSLLVDKLENAMPACGVKMPIGGMLTAAQIMQVKTWIMMGAKND